MSKKDKVGVGNGDESGAEPKLKELSVYDKNKNFVRTYSLEVHGKEFKDLAEEYAKKIGGEVRKK